VVQRSNWVGFFGIILVHCGMQLLCAEIGNEENAATHLVSDGEEKELEDTHVRSADHFRHDSLGGEPLETVPGVELLEKNRHGLRACESMHE
jgi:hypothetical protein